MAKPLRCARSNVYIRDTMLLSPAGSLTLDSLGKFYSREGDFNKRIIPDYYKEKLSNFIDEDQKGFEEFAIQDAVTTLKIL